MTYNDSILFIETSLFTKLVSNYLTENEYMELQLYLMEHPDAGNIFRGTGGIRKLRWWRQGMGKSGGIRTIYYWAKSLHQIYMLTIYSKSEQENIDKATLLKIVKTLEKM